MTLPFISISPWRMVFAIVNLLIQFWLFKKFLFAPVRKILAQRKQEVDDIYAKADAANEEAETMREEYETRLATAKEEAGELVRSATRKAQLRSEEIVEEARRESAALKMKAEAEIAQEKKKAVNEIKNELSGIAMDIAEKVVEREIDPKDHAALIDEFIENVGDAS